MNVRDDVPRQDLTEDERAIVRMWIALKLRIQIKCMDPRCSCASVWEDSSAYEPEAFEYDNFCVRLAP